MAGDKRSYYRLFWAYVLALLGTGVAVVALALLAFELTGDETRAAAVIGAALSIKTLAYVVGAPLAAAFLAGLPRRPLMVGLDLLRAGAILLLPFVGSVWQLYALIGVFTLASAAFTPAYQASVPALLPDPDDYATSLARSRVAGELEGAVSPLLAAALLAALSLAGVFLVAMAAFLASAALLATARLPAPAADAEGALSRLRSGFATLFAAPALRGLAPIALAVGAATAAVMVETVPIVRGRMGLGPEATAWAFAAFGLGSVLGALAMPRLLARAPERSVMLAAGVAMTAALAASAGVGRHATLLALWLAVGAAASLASAPASALIRRTAPAGDYQAVYAAHLALASAAAGVGYAAAGALGGSAGLGAATLALAAVSAAGVASAAALWPARRAPSPARD